MWRLQTHEQFGGTWLSDYVPNRLGGFLPTQQERQTPDCELIGRDGNIFNLIGVASRTLRRNGMEEQAREMQDRIMHGDCPSYDAALEIIGEYVNITGPSEPEEYGIRRDAVMAVPKEWLAFLREQFPEGSRIKLREMKNCGDALKPGSMGTLDRITDDGGFRVTWKDGQSTELALGTDSFSVLPPEFQALKLYMPLTAEVYEYNGYGDLEEDPQNWTAGS